MIVGQLWVLAGAVKDGARRLDENEVANGGVSAGELP